VKVCLLTPQDLDAVPFAEDDWPCDPRPFLPEAEWTVATLTKGDAVKRIHALAHEGYDLFFNLCDGAWGENSPGIEVIHALERLDLPFTGGTSQFYEPSRETMKRVCRAWGIDTPDYVVATCEADVERAAQTLQFPLFVKHPSSYASVGLTAESKVDTPDALMKQARIMLDEFSGALIEEYIDGIECTVLVAENPDDPESPITYLPLQYEFPSGEPFKHSDVKWVDYADLKSFPVEDPELAQRLRDVSSRFFLGLNATGYGRCDIRVDADGRAFMLEINANCGLYYPPEDAGSADLCLLLDPSGHEGFTRNVARAALNRHRRRSRNWEVRHHPGEQAHHAVHARRDIADDERIVEFARQDFQLVTPAEIDAVAEPRRTWMRTHSLSISDALVAVWSMNPEFWAPVGKSVTPNARWDGVDLVASRAIASGEEITVAQ
jgi:D-alanine-D-alanine ligase